MLDASVLDTLWAEILSPKDPLMAIRQKSWDRFQEIGLPRPKQEAFQYVLKKYDFPDLAEREVPTTAPIEGITFLNGFFEESLSLIPAPLVIQPLEMAVKSYGLFLQSRVTKLLTEEVDPFALLNGAFQGRGAFLYVPPKCKAALHLEHRFTTPHFTSPRLHVYLGRGAELTLSQSSSGSAGFCNGLLDFVLDEGSQLKLVDEAEGHFQSVRAHLKRDAKLKGVFLGKKVRSSLRVQLMEENSEAHLLGLSRLSGEEQAHFHATIEHLAPHTVSRQHFKSVLDERSRYSFEGKIYVKSIAQKTQSYQLNNNLILSDEATANAKPNLEIFADDVKASHGSTTGQLDAEHLFYLRSRGLSLAQARQWLIEGFCKEILDHAR